MKKGLVFVILSLAIFSIGMVLAELCTSDGTNSPTGCVCGHSPNSSMGYGQIILGGSNSTVLSCGVSDGICPEDFADTTYVPPLVGNCSSCSDPDCTVGCPTCPFPFNVTGYVWGHVRDSNGNPIEQARVTGHPIGWNNSVNLDVNATTGSNGIYNSTDFISGTYYFSASKAGYDTQLIEETVVRGSILQIDFTLQNGTCHGDCTNSYNRCNAACDGVTTSNVTCNFYNSTVRDVCNNQLQGTEVYIGPAANPYAWFVVCCNNAPFQKYYYMAFMDGSNIKNLIKTEKIARYNSVPVRVVVAYW